MRDEASLEEDMKTLLEHQWLWDIFNAKKREDVLIEDLFDETEDLPPPKPLQNWKEALDGIEYDPTVVEITKVGIAGVVGQELGGHGWKTIHYHSVD